MKTYLLLISFLLIPTSYLRAQIFEAENMQMGQGASILGQGAAIWGTGQKGWISHFWQLEGKYKMEVIAEADSFRGWPWLGIAIDNPNNLQDSILVNSKSWKSCQFILDLRQTTIFYVFLNDAWEPNVGDRNLYLDKVIFTKIDVPIDTSNVGDTLWVSWNPPTTLEDGSSYNIFIDGWGYRIYISDSTAAGPYKRWGPEPISPLITNFKDKFIGSPDIYFLYMTAVSKSIFPDGTIIAGLESKPSNLAIFEKKFIVVNPPKAPQIIEVKLK